MLMRIFRLLKQHLADTANLLSLGFEGLEPFIGKIERTASDAGASGQDWRQGHESRSTEAASPVKARRTVGHHDRAGEGGQDLVSVNAMVGVPDLLPADVNPWTSVVTSLHLNPHTAP